MQTAAACVDSARWLDFTRTCRQPGSTKIPFDGDAEVVQFLGRKQPLHAFKEFSLLSADVAGEQGGKRGQAAAIHGPAGRAVDGGTQFHVLSAKLAYERPQIRE